MVLRCAIERWKKVGRNGQTAKAFEFQFSRFQFASNLLASTERASRDLLRSCRSKANCRLRSSHAHGSS